MVPKKPPPLPALAAALLCLAGGARGEELQAWLAGLGRGSGAVPQRELARVNQADLPGKVGELLEDRAGRAELEVRIGAARVLGSIGQPGDDAERLLVRVGQETGEVRLLEAACAALASRGSERALGTLLGGLIVLGGPALEAGLSAMAHLPDGPGVGLLVAQALADKVPPRVRLRVVRRLGEVGAAQAAGRIRSLRIDRDSPGLARELECTTTVALLRLERDADLAGAALPVLLELALDAERQLAAHAIEGLALLPPLQVSSGLEAVLGESDAARRQRALQAVALLQLRTPSMVGKLSSLAEDGGGPPLLRQESVRVLGLLGDVGASQTLTTILARTPSGEEGRLLGPLRREAADALAAFGPTAAGRTALEQALTDDEPAVRRAALRGLCGFPSAGSTLNRLRNLLRRQPTAPSTEERLLRVRLAARLGETEPEWANRILETRREDDDPALALELITYTRLLPERRQFVPPLLELLAHRTSAQVRSEAHQALVTLTGQTGIPFDPEADPSGSTHRQGLQRWQQWWQGQK